MSAIKPIRMEIGPISMGSSGLYISVGKNLISIAISLSKKKKKKNDLLLWRHRQLYRLPHQPVLVGMHSEFQTTFLTFPFYSLSIFIHFYSILQTNTKDKRRSFIIASRKIGQSIIAQSEDSQHNTFTRSFSPTQNGKSQPLCVYTCAMSDRKTKIRLGGRKLSHRPYSRRRRRWRRTTTTTKKKKKKHGKNNHNKYVI